MTPETRLLLLENLAAGFPPRRALSHACGKRLTVVAWRELQDMRRVGGDGWDAEVAEACERSERRASDGKSEASEVVHGSGGRDEGAAPEGEARALVHGGGGADHATSALGSALGHLSPGRGGRATGEEEEEEGGGAEERRDMDLATVRVVEGAGDAVSVQAVVDAGSVSPVTPSIAVFWNDAANDETPPESGPVEIDESPPVRRSKRASEATDDGLPDWSTIRAEAAELAPGPFGWILWQERRLAASSANFPALSPFSLYALEHFFLSGKRWMLTLAGRGFGKSTFVSRVATAVGFSVERRAAPGPAWVCPIVSVLPVDADRRLEDIQQLLLHAYVQEVKPAKSMIAAKDTGGNPIAWVSSASTIGNVSGPSSFLAIVDEEEKIQYGRAGSIVGSLAYTFRSRPHVYGFRVSSAMGNEGTLARACAKGNGPKAPLTNYVTTLGPFVEDAVTGLLAVASWEEERGHPEAATAVRTYAATLTPDSWQIPTWLGHPSIGRPTEDAAWGPGQAAIATRIEAEATDERSLDGLAPWRYWLRECASAPTGGDEVNEWDGNGDACGELSRYDDVIGEEDRGYG